MVGYHREPHHFSEEKSTKEATAPQHTRFILPPIHPTKSSLRCVGGIFLLRELHIENFMSRPDVIPTFCQRRCKTGVGTSFGANGDQHTRAAEPSTYFCVLTIRKQLPRNGFERSGRGQEPSRGHKFSILENFVFHRDFTFQTLASFQSDLVGACLPQTLLIIRALRHEWNGVSCLHNFTEELSNRQEVQ
ncbi:hypothetical protein, partial [Phascolarctobacterium succinatutens]|uniref:hypothetical protein n=1 Tax=Phascolarctobacterium succinatutens TaxID=626940 RepID=UPI004027852F